MGFLNKVFNKNDESENEKMRQEINISELEMRDLNI